MKQIGNMSGLGKSETQLAVDGWKNQDDPDQIMKDVKSEMLNRSEFETFSMSGFKAITLNEFENGVLMTESVPDEYRTLAITMSRKLQSDYDCKIMSEKALVEIAVVSYVRFLDLQKRMEESLNTQKILSYSHDTCWTDRNRPIDDTRKNTCQRTKHELTLLTILGKELDRANNHYFMALHMLQNLRQSPMQINIRTQTAVVGQNQVLQANNNAKII
ncbi:MAG: hypothetical protein WCL07_03700 [bacterium]